MSLGQADLERVHRDVLRHMAEHPGTSYGDALGVVKFAHLCWGHPCGGAASAVAGAVSHVEDAKVAHGQGQHGKAAGIVQKARNLVSRAKGLAPALAGKGVQQSHSSTTKGPTRGLSDILQTAHDHLGNAHDALTQAATQAAAGGHLDMAGQALHGAQQALQAAGMMSEEGPARGC